MLCDETAVDLAESRGIHARGVSNSCRNHVTTTKLSKSRKTLNTSGMPGSGGEFIRMISYQVIIFHVEISQKRCRNHVTTTKLSKSRKTLNTSGMPGSGGEFIRMIFYQEIIFHVEISQKRCRNHVANI